jgi:hypothetical protein
MAIATLLCATLLTGATLQEPQTNLEQLELYRRVRSCTVKVYTEFGSTQYHGTGVALKRYGDFVMIITSSHVVALDGISPRVSVKPYGGTPLPAYVVFEHEADSIFLDLAFLVVRDSNRKIAIAEKGADADWRKKTVYSCGNPQNEEFLVDHGNVLPVANAPDEAQKCGWVVCHDALTEHGNSGGGLFDSEGKLVGINTWLYKDRITLAIDLDLFPSLFDIRVTTISANASNWVKDSSVPAGSSVYALAVGRWRCDPALDSIDPGGYSGSSQKRVVSGLNYGSALIKVGDRVACFNHAHSGPNGSSVIYSDARTAQVLANGGDVSLRINDNRANDNSGQVAVFYIVVYPAAR